MIENNCIPVFPNNLRAFFTAINGGLLFYTPWLGSIAIPVFGNKALYNVAGVSPFLRSIERFERDDLSSKNIVEKGISSRYGKTLNDLNSWRYNIKNRIPVSYSLISQVGITCGIPNTYKTTI